jgi:V/A-type H+-transporting ATPase subunit A
VSEAVIVAVGGPVLRAKASGPFALREAVEVGERALLGEVVMLDGDEIVAQVYEDTTGLRPGVVVHGRGSPLAIPLGPALLGRMFDGLLRPLVRGASAFVRPGMRHARGERFAFAPHVAAGDELAAGAILGELSREDGVVTQRCLLPPTASGIVLSIVDAGIYADDERIATLRAPDGVRFDVAMTHWWPVRTPRPVLARRPARAPLVTGQRILDTLFPVAQGGKAAIPGGFGTGKTVLLEALAKGCDADVIVYLGCGERGNEMAGVLAEFPALVDPRSGRRLMERTVKWWSP